jgi:hypothetical protein
MDTKLCPSASRLGMSPQNYSHSLKDLLKVLMDSLKALKPDNQNTLHLHELDRAVYFRSDAAQSQQAA